MRLFALVSNQIWTLSIKMIVSELKGGKRNMEVVRNNWVNMLLGVRECMCERECVRPCGCGCIYASVSEWNEYDN